MKIATTMEYAATPQEVFAVLTDQAFQEAKCAATAAISRLLAGPAAAMSAKSRRGFFRYRMSTGTGFAQPIKGMGENIASSGNNTVPIQSMWASGFSVSRPRSRAVGSPRRLALQACAAS